MVQNVDGSLHKIQTRYDLLIIFPVVGYIIFLKQQTKTIKSMGFSRCRGCKIVWFCKDYKLELYQMIETNYKIITLKKFF